MFTRFQVFDCTRRTGVACYVRGAWLALIVATILSRSTGRFHDFMPAHFPTPLRT